MDKNLKNNISVVYIVGGKYDKAIYKESLDSVSWASEIVKVDSDTIGGNFSELRNMGAQKAKCDWLLYIDTDEIITKQLKAEILKFVKFENYSAFAIPRRNFIFGREMKHCGLWPDYVVRLIKKDKLISWEGQLHEQPKIEGEIHHLSEPLIHKKHDNLSDMVDKTNQWSEIEAKLMLEANHPPMNIWRFGSAAFREFWKRMIIQAAFLDGTYGTIYGIYQVYSRLISYSKLWELQIKT